MSRRIGWMIAGAALIAARVIIPAVPDIWTKVPLNEAQGMCNGVVGQIAGAMDHSVQADCNAVATVMTVLNVLALAGVALVVVFGVLWLRDNGMIRRDRWPV